MVRGNRTKEPRDAGGRRLERYIKERWPRSKGGIRGLAAKIGTTPETMYAWFRGDSEPSLAHLRVLADQLAVTRWTLVAVMDGSLPNSEPGESTEARLKALEADLRLLRARLEAGVSPAPLVQDGTRE